MARPPVRTLVPCPMRVQPIFDFHDRCHYLDIRGKLSSIKLPASWLCCEAIDFQCA